MFKKGSDFHAFLGGNTPLGFYNYFDSLADQTTANRFYCIKGGPGTGKSGFMKNIASKLIETGHNTELFHCSSDPDSLDGVACSDFGIALVDGTSPHTVDPHIPGAIGEIINLGDYWDETRIAKYKNEIIDLNKRIGANFSNAYSYINASRQIYDINARQTQKYIDEMNAHKVADGIIEAEKLTTRAFKKGKMRKLFASAITPKGFYNFVGKIAAKAQKQYVFDCDHGVGAEIIITDIVQAALLCGYDVEAFFCPLDPIAKIEHVYIPAIKTCFLSSNKYHTVTGGEKIPLDEYLPNGMFNTNVEIFDNILSKAVDCLKSAKCLHDDLEEYYVQSMDFGLISEYSDIVFEKIVNRPLVK